MMIRRARATDADAINEIYNPFIQSSPATFELTPWTTQERATWIETGEKQVDQVAQVGDPVGVLGGDRGRAVDDAPAARRDPRHPVTVAETAGQKITGFAAAAAFDPRGAYGSSIKTSVFVDPSCHGTGVGSALYSALFEAITVQSTGQGRGQGIHGSRGIHRAYGLIVAPNPASEALHERFGFAHIATLSEVGFKFGKFHDVKWFEKRFCE